MSSGPSPCAGAWAGRWRGSPTTVRSTPLSGASRLAPLNTAFQFWGPCTSSGVPCRASCVLPCTATTPQPPVSCWELQRHPIANLPSTQSQRHPTTTVVADPNVPNPTLATNTLRASYINSSDIYSALPTNFKTDLSTDKHQFPTTTTSH
ncbi:hypothetical protein VTJ04DRAFT_900 [Mycothermus thermophilus]|uniref:uncharacterized protein n=1 Tax=Humicola insolens TaxID=85995 RepID=UPI003744136F